ncbi:hypothetical protein NPA31_015660 [Aurantimonas sp. MSK8Z-1]|uniref:hypothetical protein n=1 Tax=Mangrovibrevibacter kandeliae TaxID=2968473 RepID=UPI002231D2AA|nr:hypothetical protein [Aurantimonas sp. MSK8Z-1]MCW4116399.1 hypothetical protein [Aurantimonas sp. MSK8Z-1]
MSMAGIPDKKMVNVGGVLASVRDKLAQYADDPALSKIEVSIDIRTFADGAQTDHRVMVCSPVVTDD